MMMAAHDGGSRGRLRTATNDAHARVDACFPSGLSDHNAYARYLRGMHALVSALESALATAPLSDAWAQWRRPQRVDWLADDLRVVGHSPLAVGPGLSLSGDAEAAGALYVVEGSALGATQLRDDAHALGWNPQWGARFLDRHGGEGAGTRWRDYVRHLEATSLDAAAEQAMFAAAARTFAYAEHEFLRAERNDDAA